MQPSVAQAGAVERSLTSNRAPIPQFVGWILIAPAAVLFLLMYVWPTLKLLTAGLFGTGAGRAWSFILSPAYLSQIGHALSFAFLPILVIAVLAPAIAWAASRAGIVGRWAMRASLAFPLAAFAPAGLALMWTHRHRPGHLSESVRPTFAQWDGRIVLLATMGAFVLAVAVVCYLAAFRRRETAERIRVPVTVVGVLLAIVALGFAVQQYTFVTLVEQAPLNDTTSTGSTPMALLDLGTFEVRQAAAAVPVMVILAVLGLAAALVVLRSGLRLEFDPNARGIDDGPAPAGSRTVALIGTAAGIAGILLLIVFQLGPWLSAVATGGARLPARFPASSVLLNTWLIPLGAALLQVVVAAAAAFGIAVVRPLGWRSEWLLLAFAPWLLVGNALLELPRLSPEGSDGLQPLIAYAPPSWVSIPTLFLLTVLFRGQAGQWRRSRAAGHPNAVLRAMWPALPMVVLAVGVAWLVQAQDLLVPTMADNGKGVVPNGQLIMVRGAISPLSTAQPALGYPLVMLVLFTLGALVLQCLYLDRIAVRVGRSPDR